MKDRRHTDPERIDSELIGIVYEVAFDQNFWPGFLESISQLFNDRRSDGLRPDSVPDEHTQLFSQRLDETEKQRLATLLPHLSRALKLKRNYNSADHTRGQAQAIIDQFPIGVLLVSASSEVISANKQALTIIAESNMVYLEEGMIGATLKEGDRELKRLIERAATAGLDVAGRYVSSLRIDGEDEAVSLSLLVTPDPYPATQYGQPIENCAAIFIASVSAGEQVSLTALQTLFGLTQAEARLAALLASGVNLSQAAEQSYISKNTAKVQLKSIFSKLGVSRQAELIKVILTSPAVIRPANGVQDDARQNADLTLRARINMEESVRLRDGRRLQYAEFGDPQGTPVIFVHGILGCRYERLPDDQLTRNLGVRLIVPDRPSYGLSDPAPGQGYLGFADDLLQLVDHLALAQCHIMGLSVGAIYGSAFAFASPQRVRHLAMVSATPPFRAFADFADMPASLKLLVSFSKYLPAAARMISETAINNACKDAGKFLANIPICASDLAIFSRPQLQEHFKFCLLEGNRHHRSGFVDEILLSAQPWPFDIASVQTPIEFWHGTEDTHSPLSRVQPVIDAAPNERLHKINGGGHFLIYDHWQAILETLIH